MEKFEFYSTAILAQRINGLITIIQEGKTKYKEGDKVTLKSGETCEILDVVSGNGYGAIRLRIDEHSFENPTLIGHWTYLVDSSKHIIIHVNEWEIKGESIMEMTTKQIKDAISKLAPSHGPDEPTPQSIRMAQLMLELQSKSDFTKPINKPIRKIVEIAYEDDEDADKAMFDMVFFGIILVGDDENCNFGVTLNPAMFPQFENLSKINLTPLSESKCS